MTARGLRAFGFGFSAVLIGIHLERRGLSAGLIGLTIGIALAAGSLSGLFTAWLASKAGRRPTLGLCGLLMAATGAVLASSITNPALLVASGLTGMLGAASVDLGPFSSIEQAMLAEAVDARSRNLAFGRYSLVAGLANAAGGAAAALAAAIPTSSFYLVYFAIGAVTSVLPILMSSAVETTAPPVAFGDFRPLAALASLFALDSLGGGFVANGVIAYWLHARFGATSEFLGPVFAGVALLQAISYEVSGRLGNRIGLINTMVFTHLPSNLFLLLVPFAPSLAAATAILFARFALSQMDVPARQAYLASIVPPAERAGALAMTGAVRGVAQSFGPVLTGIAIGASAFGFPFWAGGGLKIVYDLALYAGFRRRPASHES